jgi:GR25 family glycosyltransferase involved in LPS biosynthesis
MKKNNYNYNWIVLGYILLACIIIGIIIYYVTYKREGFGENATNYLDGVDIIYWINLDRSKDRRDNMKKMLKDKVFDGITQQRISAYDGKMNPKSVFDKLNINNKQKLESDTVYACLLSHLETIRTFNESDREVALIFEDDVTLEFKKYWKKTVKEIMDNAPHDWEIIMLTYTFAGRNSNKRLFYNWDIVSDKEYEKNNDKYYSTVAYIINKKGSNKLMTHTENNKYNIYSNINPGADVYLYQLLNTYTYKYPMFIYKSDNDSLIHPDHLSIHLVSKNKLLENYKTINK